MIDKQLIDNTYNFRLGHVERVFTSTEDQIINDTTVPAINTCRIIFNFPLRPSLVFFDTLIKSSIKPINP